MEEENELYEEVKQYLEELIRITYAIKEVYDMLSYLYAFGPLIKEFETKKLNILNKLRALKKQENDIYEYFKEEYTRATYALNILEENEENNTSMKKKELICYDRIHDKLSVIEIEEGIKEDYENNIDDLKAFKKFKILTKAGIDEEEATIIYLDYSKILDTSLSVRYASLLEDEIMKGNTPFIFIKERLNEAFKSPNDLEDILLNINFNRLPRNLNEELKPNYSLDPNLINEFIRLEIEDCLLEVLNKINITKDQNELKVLIIQYKTYLLYLTDFDIKRTISFIESWIQDDNLREYLTQMAFNYHEYQKNQNIDSHQKGRNL